MRLSRLSDGVLGWFRRAIAWDHTPLTVRRGPRDHVIILDGTMSLLEPGYETNAGLLYRLLKERGGEISLYYEAGVQWAGWRSMPHVLMGRGINQQICRAYGFLASRYRPGDRIFLFGYSRGAFAVRSLAGVIDRIGLVRADAATERNVRQVYRLYRHGPNSAAAQDFIRLHCHDQPEITVVGCWDTVKALGLRVPLVWRVTDDKHAFHNDQLGPSIKHGFHALAYHETRKAFDPVLWHCPPGWQGHVEQVWFKGVHGDVGGQLRGHEAARPLSNIPLRWMLERAEACGLALPDDWTAQFPEDPTAPSVGNWRGWGKLFLLRGVRVVGEDPSERLHETLLADIPDGDVVPLA